MTADSRVRRFWIGVMAIAVSSALFLWEGFSSSRVSDAEISRGAPEDTFGLGIFPVFLLGALGLAALIWVWQHASRVSERRVAGIATLALLGSATFAIHAYNLLRGRVLG